MFAASFPLAPVLAALNNVVEIRTDALKLLVTSEIFSHNFCRLHTPDLNTRDPEVLDFGTESLKFLESSASLQIVFLLDFLSIQLPMHLEEFQHFQVLEEFLKSTSKYL